MQSTPLPEESVCLMLAVEADLSEHAHGLSLPPPLDKAAATQLSELVAADLTALLGDISAFGMVVAGALYEQPQLLSPGYPVFNTLRAMYIKAQQAGDSDRPFEAGLMALGAANGVFPEAALNPHDSDAAGPLLLVPIVLTGDADALRELASKTEEVLLNQGQARPETAISLIELFAVNPLHARYMTLHDLCAMLSMQLTHIGLPELWELLDAQLLTGESRVVKSAIGNLFRTTPQGVDVTCMSFNSWARDHRQRSPDADLAGDYAQYVRVQRQVVTALRAHGVDVRLLLLGPGESGPFDEIDHWPGDLDVLDEAFVREVAVDGVAEGHIEVTEQSTADLGTLAYTVQWNSDDGISRLEHYYPLRARGLHEILDHLRELYQDDLVFNYPGKLCIDEDNATLVSF